MRLAPVVVLLAFAFASAAVLAESGTVPLDCYDTTYEGRCEDGGAYATYCNDPAGLYPIVQQQDCAPRGCEYVADVGYRCISEPGDPCVRGSLDEPNACVPGALSTEALACDVVDGCVTADDVVCDGDGGALARACVGDVFVLRCLAWGQALQIDCAALGGTCGNGGCSGIPEGGRCGTDVHCADGLGCAPFVFGGSIGGECRPRSCEEATFEPSCLDEDQLAWRCTEWGEPVIARCDELVAQCVEGECIYTGGACDLASTRARCPDGLVCRLVNGVDWCRPPLVDGGPVVVTDGGSRAAGDAGRVGDGGRALADGGGGDAGARDEVPGCTCGATSARADVWLSGVALAVAFAWGRRRRL